MKTEDISEELLKKIENEARECIEEFITEDKLGYKYYLYQEMQKRFKSLDIEWEIPCNDFDGVIVEKI